MQLLSSSQLKQVRLGRRELEVNAAKVIGRYLLATQKAYIKRLILTMIDKIFALLDESPGTVEGFLIRQTNFAMWKHCHTVPNSHGLGRVANQIASYQLESYAWLNVCSDVIRLFGEFAEQGWVKNRRDTNWQIMARKDDLRPQPVFAKPETSQVGWGHRHRLNKTRAEMARIGAPFMDIPRERVEWRGAEMFKFGEDSVIATLDWVYGLQEEGGDVSGTTTDSIAAMRWASRQENQVNPIVQLIAIAAMVPQGHHTIVECAWPLTRHGYMNYHIGFYDTLVPAEGYSGVAKILKILDNDARNKHVLVCRAMGKSDWRTWKQQGGKIVAPVKELALHFDSPEEIALYRRLANVRSAYGFCVGGRPTLDSLANLVRTRAPGVQGQRIIDSMFSKYHMA